MVFRDERSERIIKQLRLPYGIYVCRIVWRNFIVFLHTIVIYIPVMVYFQLRPGASMVLVIPGLVLLLATGLLWPQPARSCQSWHRFSFFPEAAGPGSALFPLSRWTSVWHCSVMILLRPAVYSVAILALAAMNAGALGCSISGAGPTMFAWAQAEHAEGVLATMRREFGKQSIAIDEWIVDAQSSGAHLI